MVATNFAAATGQRISSSAIDAAFAQALTANGGDASATTVKPVYPGGASAAYPRSMSDILGQVIRLKDFGAPGDNITESSEQINAAIAAINAIPASSQPFPVTLLVEPGYYYYNSPLTPITAPCRILATDPRGAGLRPVGNFDALTFAGSSAAALSYGGLRGLEINCSGMTGGHAVVADTTQDFTILDALIFGSSSSTFDGISLRQCGDTILEKIELLGFANYGLKGYGTFASRNGGLDTNNVVTLRDSSLCGSWNGARTTNNADAIWFDGAMQTFRVETSDCINAGRGLRLTNTPGVANPHFTQFVYGSDFEVENMYNECIRAETVIAMIFHTLFVAGSASQSNIYLGSQAYGTKLFGGESSAAYQHGIDIEGADNTEINGFDVYNNSQYVAAGLDAIHCNTSGNVRIAGGNIGKLLAKFGDAGYTAENQRYGIANVGSGYVSALGSYLLGNSGADNGGAYTGTVQNISTCRTS